MRTPDQMRHNAEYVIAYVDQEDVAPVPIAREAAEDVLALLATREELLAAIHRITDGGTCFCHHTTKHKTHPRPCGQCGARALVAKAEGRP